MHIANNGSTGLYPSHVMDTSASKQPASHCAATPPVDAVPFMVEWGRNMNLALSKMKFRTLEVDDPYLQRNAGGDCFLLPLRSYDSSHFNSKDYDCFILHDCGRPGAFIHILHFLGLETPYTLPWFGSFEAQHEVYGITSTRPRRLVGVICTHLDQDHFSGLKVLVDIAYGKKLHDNHRKEIETHFGLETSFAPASNAVWRRVCKEALKWLEFVVFPGNLGFKQDISSLTKDWNGLSGGTDASLEEIFMKTGGQVIVRNPDANNPLTYFRKKESATNNESVKTDGSKEEDKPEQSDEEKGGPEGNDFPEENGSAPISPTATPQRNTSSAPLRPSSIESTPQTPVRQAPLTNLPPTPFRTLSPRPQNASLPDPPVQSTDTSEKNKSSLITCYIGFYNNQQIHFAFVGDSPEDTAMEVRKRLPPNKHAYAKVLKSELKMVIDELFLSDGSFDKQRRDKLSKIAAVLYDSKPRFTDSKEKWDMLQLSHHGSIKNVRTYLEDKKPFTAQKLGEHLTAKAKGFFVTSPGTFCHADPRIFDAMVECAKNVDVIHVANETVVGKNGDHVLHDSYDELAQLRGIKKNILALSFTEQPLRCAAALIPEPPARITQDTKTLVKELASLRRPRTGTSTGIGTATCDMMRHLSKLLPGDEHTVFRSFVEGIIHIRDVYKVIPMMVSCLHRVQYRPQEEWRPLMTSIVDILKDMQDTCNLALSLSLAVTTCSTTSKSNHSSTPTSTAEADKLSILHVVLAQMCHLWYEMYMWKNECDDLSNKPRSLYLEVINGCARALLASSSDPKQDSTARTERTSSPEGVSTSTTIPSDWESFIVYHLKSVGVSGSVADVLCKIRQMWDDLGKKSEKLGKKSEKKCGTTESDQSTLDAPMWYRAVHAEIDKALAFVAKNGPAIDDITGGKLLRLRVKLLDCLCSMSTLFTPQNASSSADTSVSSSLSILETKTQPETETETQPETETETQPETEDEESNDVEEEEKRVNEDGPDGADDNAAENVSKRLNFNTDA